MTKEKVNLPILSQSIEEANCRIDCTGLSSSSEGDFSGEYKLIIQRSKEPLRYVKNDDDEAFKIFQDNETNWQVSYTFTVQ